MYDQKIRAAFHLRVLQKAHNSCDTLVIDELGIDNGSYRADIAVLNGKFEGFEIKGEFDTLDRLPSQVAAYNSIFDKISLITCEKFLNDCQEIIPSWWGIYLAYPSIRAKGNVIFDKVRSAKKNETLDPYSLARLLWRNEALNIASPYAEGKFLARANRHEIYRILADNIAVKDLSKLVLATLKERNSWRQDRQQPL